jgi:starvation-inducible DNA-binding protein
MTDDIAERVRKIGGTTARSIGHIARLQRIHDNDAEYVTPADMLSELHEDETGFTLSMRAVHALCPAPDLRYRNLVLKQMIQMKNRISVC